MRWRTPLFLALVALLVSLSSVPAAAQANTAEADKREILAYQLTMPKLKALNQFFADLQKQRESDPAYRDLVGKKKELAALGEKDELSDAEQDRLGQLEAEIEAAEQAEEEPEDEVKSLSEMAGRMAADPRIAGAIKRAGLIPREAAILQLAMFQAGFAQSLLEAGTIKELPKDVNAENVRFWQTHKAEIEALTALSDQREKE